MAIGDEMDLKNGDDYFMDDLRKDFNVQADDVKSNRLEMSSLSQEDQLNNDRKIEDIIDSERGRSGEEGSGDKSLIKEIGIEDKKGNKNVINNEIKNVEKNIIKNVIENVIENVIQIEIRNEIKNINDNKMKNEIKNVNDNQIKNEIKNENRNIDVGVSFIGTNNKNKKIVLRYGRKETPGFWKVKKIGASDWMTFDLNSNWVWWAAAGYSVSVLLFRVADWLNGSVVPSDWFDDAADSIVHQMITPEENDIIALLIGAIAPCLSAPLWEEVFYRGLIYPFLCSVFPMALATPLSALIFALHHGRKQVFIQLFTLGSMWASLYVLSGNLFVSVVVHSLWNSRVFLGSFLGY